MNGLRPSLTTETRRHYPTTTQDLLKQVKIAEELTASSTIFASNYIDNDDTTPYQTISTSTNNFKHSSRVYNEDYHYHKNPQHCLNKISNSSYDNSSERHQPSHLTCEIPNIKSSSNFIPSLLNNNNPYQNNNHAYQDKNFKQQQQSYQRCFKCGSFDHIARHSDGLTSFIVTGVVHLNIYIGEIKTSISAYVTPVLCTNLILGMNYLLNSSNSQTTTTNTQLNTITTPPSPILPQQVILNLLSHITYQVQHDQIQSLLLKFQSTFDTSKYTIARTKIFHAIETYPHAPPVSKSYPSNLTTNSEMRLIINKLITAGLIRESKSSYAAPALLIKKKDHSWRLIIDYKKLNSITIKDNYPLPNMEITLQTLDRFKTAFITPFDLYEWSVFPQGLRNAPPSFQRIMNKVLSSCTDFSLVYLDDIIIFSRTYDEHLIHLKQILNALQLHNLIVNSTKCELVKQTMEYLGHVINSTTITPLPDKIKSISLLPEPKSLAQANRLIGALSWYRKFIPRFASIVAPIHAVTNLTKSNRHKFKWGSEQSKAFRDLKHLLISSPLFLNFPDDTQPVLLSSSQKRYHPIELEALAIFKCINRMKSFLYGRDIIIFTDNCSLCKYNCLPDYLSRHPISYDDELLDSEYGLEFRQDQSSSIQLIGAVVTRSKAKAAANATSSSSSPPQQQ
ncbi:unnamed protein product [Rotaria sp. Silwood2]|nr:unnamed protein product [Rotaria sp. Silwood2]CAF4431991.1 unnamed protein product [Rotaria sp. Silwood2]